MEHTHQKITTTKVFLVGLNPYFTKQAITDYFTIKQNSPVKKLKFLNKKLKGKVSSGCAMMELFTEKDAKRLLAIDCFKLQDRKFFVKPFLQGKQRKKFKEQVRKRRVFIHNVVPSLCTDDIRRIFGCVAQIEDAFLIGGPNSQQESYCEELTFRFGFVMFKHVKDAEKWKQIGQLAYQGGVILISPYKDSGKIDTQKLVIERQSYFLDKKNQENNQIDFEESGIRENLKFSGKKDFCHKDQDFVYHKKYQNFDGCDKNQYFHASENRQNYYYQNKKNQVFYSQQDQNRLNLHQSKYSQSYKYNYNLNKSSKVKKNKKRTNVKNHYIEKNFYREKNSIEKNPKNPLSIP